MNLTETPAGRAVAWSRELPQLLAACGPLAAISAAALLRAAGHIVTVEEVEQELASRLDVHETDEGWVSVAAIAEGSVLTTQLTQQACQTGVIAAGGDLDLWARLAVPRGMPLRSGDALRRAEVSLLAEGSLLAEVSPRAEVSLLAEVSPRAEVSPQAACR